MDKYEFSLKMEQMKKLIHEEDYVTAFKIADSIDWNRVRNINLLTMAATVYEKNDRLEAAKKILNLALDRAPVGKRLLYKLTELAVRTGELEQAEEYYYEYRAVDAEDIGNYVLQYMILKARHAPYDRQLQPLELYCQRDPDEKWLYELATTYEFAGRTTDCVRTCDRIALLYGNSTYGLKALRLKMRYANLSDEQKNMLYPRSVSVNEDSQPTGVETDAGYGHQEAYEDGYKGNAGTGEEAYQAYQQDAGRNSNPYAEYGLTQEPDISSVEALTREAPEEYESISANREAALRNSDALAAARYENEDAEFDAYVLNMERAMQQEAAEAARRAEEERLAAIKAENEEKEARARAEAMRFQAQAQQAAMEKQAEQNKLQAEAETEEEQAPLEEASEAESEGRQMTFDFGNGAEEPKLIEEPEISEEPAEDAENSSAKENPTKELIKAAPMSTLDAVEAALNGAAALQAAAAIPAAPVPVQAVPYKTASAAASVRTADEEAYKAAQRDAYKKPQSEAAPAAQNTAEKPADIRRYDMIVEAENIEDGLSIAVDELKAIHEENKIQHASVKTSADKLNSIGFTESIANKIKGKDFVVEKAGDLDDDVIEGIYRFIKTDRSGSIVVLIDTPEGLDNIEDIRPELFDICDYVSDIEDDELEELTDKKSADAHRKTADVDEDFDEEPYDDEAYEDMSDIDGSKDEEAYDDTDDDFEDDDLDDESDEEDEPDVHYNDKKKPQKRSSGKVKEKFSNVRTVKPTGDEEQMEIDDFVQYCSQYASEIDCSITGKSMLALYERVELMEEDGIPLNKANAEALIEEAADRAEKPPMGKRLTGMFHSRYDKNGCLILKEDDFIH